jgi:putative inorganic carbon (hco3(-)) transporter
MTYFFAFIFILLVFFRPQEWLIPWLFGWPLLDVITYVALLALLLETDSGQISFPKRTPQVLLLAGLLIAACLSHVSHTYLAGIMYTFPEVFKVCFFTVLLISVLDRPSRIRSVARVFTVMAVLMSVHALLQNRRGFGFAGQEPLWIPAIGDRPAHTRTQFFGIFSDPNDLAQILATCIPLTFVLTRRRNLLSLLVGCALSWLFIEAILTTHSRGGMLGLVTVLTLMGGLVLPARWQPAVLSLMAVSGLALSPLSAGWLDQSAHDRVVFWGMANEYFKGSPLFGIGYGMFWMITSNMTAHNAFVLCYTEVGVVGYWFWFTTLLIGFVGLWRARTALRGLDDPESVWLRRMSGMSIAAAGGFCVSSYFLSRTFIYPLFFLFAVMAAVPRVSEDYVGEDHESLQLPWKDVVIWGTVGTLTSIVYIYFSIVLLNKAFY